MTAGWRRRLFAPMDAIDATDTCGVFLLALRPCAKITDIAYVYGATSVTPKCIS